MKSIYIYHPSDILGGSEFFFLQLAVFLQVEKKHNVTIIDCHGGALFKEINRSRYPIKVIVDEEMKEVKNNSVIILSARNISKMYSGRLPEKLEQKEISIFTILLHPSELYSNLFIGTTKIKKILGYHCLRFMICHMPGFKWYRHELISLSENESLFFMDSSCVKESSWFFNFEFDKKKILPLFIGCESSTSCEFPSELKKMKGGINGKICIISKLSGFKYYGVEKVVIDLINNPSLCSELHIIGDGGNLPELKSILYHSKLNVIYHGYIMKDNIRNILLESEINCVFAMGTAALEGISLGILTVLLPALDRRVHRDNIYKILHLQNEITLGEYIETPFSDDDYLSFDMLKEYISSHDMARDKIVKYYLDHYNESTNKERLYEKIVGASYFSFSKPSKIASKYFSVVNTMKNQRLR
ncbi:hypothetical protein [Edwardsiella tarda]